MKRIFAPFERAAQDVNSEGFGLGLFLTKGLIKVLEGMDVEVHSVKEAYSGWNFLCLKRMS